MNCQNHPDVAAIAYCRTCGKPVCADCRREASGTVYCAEHAPAAVPPPFAAPPPAYTAPPPASTLPYPPPAAPSPYVRADIRPGLAFALGWIPGVGAIYNGQYAKGLIHAVIWGVLMSIANSDAIRDMQPIFVILVIAWMAYMVFEAYRTAQKLQRGEPVDEYSSVLQLRGGPGRFPMAAVALIVLGVLLLLHTLDLVNFERIVPYWPVLLIAAGAYMLWSRFAGQEPAPGEMRHER
ncbi:MAG: B-box zinc finger protein [Bryobacteraceae bacterium]